MGVKLTSAQLKSKPAEVIGPKLRSNYRGKTGTTTWSQVMTASAKAGNPVGEIRTAADIKKAPTGKRLRAVYFPQDPNGPVIRWGDSSAAQTKLIGGVNHDYFQRKGDNVTGGKQGYITVDSSGAITVG